MLGSVLGAPYAHLSGALARYALATTAFAVANLVASHHLSTGRVRESWLLLCGGAIQTATLLVFHGSIDQLVNAQLVAMGLALLVVVVSPAASRRRAEPGDESHLPIEHSDIERTSAS